MVSKSLFITLTLDVPLVLIDTEIKLLKVHLFTGGCFPNNNKGIFINKACLQMYLCSPLKEAKEASLILKMFLKGGSLTSFQEVFLAFTH